MATFPDEDHLLVRHLETVRDETFVIYTGISDKRKYFCKVLKEQNKMLQKLQAFSKTYSIVFAKACPVRRTVLRKMLSEVGILAKKQSEFGLKFFKYFTLLQKVQSELDMHTSFLKKNSLSVVVGQLLYKFTELAYLNKKWAQMLSECNIEQLSFVWDVSKLNLCMRNYLEELTVLGLADVKF